MGDKNWDFSDIFLIGIFYREFSLSFLTPRIFSSDEVGFKKKNSKNRIHIFSHKSQITFWIALFCRKFVTEFSNSQDFFWILKFFLNKAGFRKFIALSACPRSCKFHGTKNFRCFITRKNSRWLRIKGFYQNFELQGGRCHNLVPFNHVSE